MRNRPTIPGITPSLPICTIYCIGRNYLKHAEELNNKVPDEPVVFIKPSSTVIYDGETIKLPPRSNEVHHEVELVAAIGKEGKNIPGRHALEYVAGYGIGIDVTARDIQQKAKNESLPWAVAKGFDTFAPVSEFVPSSQIDDPGTLELSLEVNGATRQQGNTRSMIFPVQELISFLSDIFTLMPGDLIFTGTPEGVSKIESGDEITATLQNGLKTLTVHVE